MTKTEQIEKAIAFLEECNKDIEDFPTKLGSYLKASTISHLRNPVNGGLLYEEASTLIYEWIITKEESNEWRMDYNKGPHL